MNPKQTRVRCLFCCNLFTNGHIFYFQDSSVSPNLWSHCLFCFFSIIHFLLINDKVLNLQHERPLLKVCSKQLKNHTRACLLKRAQRWVKDGYYADRCLLSSVWEYRFLAGAAAVLWFRPLPLLLEEYIFLKYFPLFDNKIFTENCMSKYNRGGKWGQ